MKNPSRAIHDNVVTIVIKITNNKTGFSDTSFLGIGYNGDKKKKEILELIEEAVNAFVKDSPTISAEFINIQSLTSKKGKY